MEHRENRISPACIFDELKRGRNYKGGLGKRGMYEQNRLNERFYAGDQWHGAKCGDEKGLLVLNLIRRIGEYKLSMVDNPVSVVYSAEGVPNTREMQERMEQQKETLRLQNMTGGPVETGGMSETEKINLAMAAMTDYFAVTAERVKLDDLRGEALRKSYITGTGVLYTYWDERIQTGMYADEGRTSPIVGDLRCEVLDVENVYFGDPTLDNVQDQPYILLTQRRRVDDLRREARAAGRTEEEVSAIHADEDKDHSAGMGDGREELAKKATVVTKLWKEWDKTGKTYKVMATVVTAGAVVRPPWDIQVRLYPVAKLSWDRRAGCIYGDSEVTHLIPNQIALNRTVTATVQAALMNGMPIMVVNGDVVGQPITNDPGQIVTVYGDSADVQNAVRYVQPPAFSAQLESVTASLIQNTLTQAGANDAALGDMRPDNTSAIVALREAATMPLQLLQNRYYSFIEDVARIWADFWVSMYGARKLKMEDKNGTWYIPFNGADYRKLLITARVDVGATGLWSEIQNRQTLDNLLLNKIITPLQYLERLPRGTVPRLGELIQELKEQGNGDPSTALGMTGEGGMTGGGAAPDVGALLEQLPPDYRQAFDQLPPEQQQQALDSLMGK